MDDSDPLPAPHRAPTPNRPLLGLTILVVEDSRYASEAMRLLCLRSGARIRRADSLRAARRHLQVYRPSAVIIDLGLPDGSGLDLIRELAQAVPRVGALLAISADATAADAARAAGADDFLLKPVTGLAAFQSAVLARLPADRQPIGPRLLSDDHVDPDPLALQDDLALVAERLGDARGTELDYVAQFIAGVAQSVNDTDLVRAAGALARARSSGASATAETARMAGLLRARLSHRQAI